MMLLSSNVSVVISKQTDINNNELLAQKVITNNYILTLHNKTYLHNVKI